MQAKNSLDLLIMNEETKPVKRAKYESSQPAEMSSQSATTNKSKIKPPITEDVLQQARRASQAKHQKGNAPTPGTLLSNSDDANSDLLTISIEHLPQMSPTQSADVEAFKLAWREHNPMSKQNSRSTRVSQSLPHPTSCTITSQRHSRG